MPKYKSFDDFAKDLTRAVGEIAKSENMRDLAQMGADKIRVRTRLGKGVDANLGDPKALSPDLSKGYQRYKNRLKAKAVPKKASRAQRKASLTAAGLDPNVSFGAKSNLTLTGQLLNSLKGESDKPGEGVIRLTGTRKGGTLTNEKLGQYVQDYGRVFMNLSKAEFEQLRQQVVKTINGLIKKFE